MSFIKVSDLIDYGQSLVTDGVVTPLFSAAVVGIVGLAGARYGTIRALKLLAAGQIVAEELKVSVSNYWPSGVVNPQTGNEYFDQDIKVIGEVSLSDIFNQSLRGPIVKAIKRAQKDTTRHSPIVFSHLQAHVKPKDWAAMRFAVSAFTRSHFSQMFNSASASLSNDIEPRQRPDYQLVLPLMVGEESITEKMSFKFLALKIRDGNIISPPPIESVRFFDPACDPWRPSYKPGKDQPFAIRHKLITTVIEQLNKPENLWLKDLTVRVNTGRYIDVPAL